MAIEFWSRLRARALSLVRSRRPPYGLLAGVLVVLGLILVVSAFHKGGLWREGRFNDFMAYHRAAVAAVHGDLTPAYEDPERPYQYPPTLAALIVPLGLLSYRAGLVIWVLGSLLLVFWVLRVLDEVLCPPVEGLDKFLGIVLTYRFLQSDFANTNANTIVLALLTAGFLLERRRHSLAAGGVLALAACVKVFPLLIFPWMVYRQRWRNTTGFLGGLLLWGALVPGTILGPRALVNGLEHWYEGVLAPINVLSADYATGPAAEYVPGQSLRALLHHVLRRTDASAHDDEVVTVNLVDLSPLQVDGVWGVGGLLLLGLALRRFRHEGQAAVWGGRELSIAILLCVVLSPIARKAHFVVLLPAAAFAFAAARSAVPSRRRLLLGLWTLALLLVVATSPGLLGPWLSKRAMAFCPLTLAAFLLGAILWVRPTASPLRPGDLAPSCGESPPLSGGPGPAVSRLGSAPGGW